VMEFRNIPRGRPITAVEQVVDIRTQSHILAGNPDIVATVSASRRMDRKWNCHVAKTVAKDVLFKAK